MSRSTNLQLASCLLKTIIAVPATFGEQSWKKLISPSLLLSMETRNCQAGNISWCASKLLSVVNLRRDRAATCLPSVLSSWQSRVTTLWLRLVS